MVKTIALVAVGLLLAACASAPDAPISEGPARPDRPADLTGTITSISPFEPITEECVEPDPGAPPDQAVSSDDPPMCTDPDAGQRGSVLIEADPGAQGGDAAVVRVDASTVLLRNAGTDVAEIAFDELRVGQTAAAWFDGPVAESYPLQAGGAALVVHDGPS